MKMLLLVCALALLVSPRYIQASDLIRLELKAIIDKAEKCKESLTEDIFVDSVSDLAQGRDKCGDKFFCKVQEILLKKHEDFCGNKTVLVRTLQAYNRNVQCENTQQGVTPSVEVQMSTFLGEVIGCVRHTLFHGTYKN